MTHDPPNLHRDRSAEIDVRPIIAAVERMTGQRVERMEGYETLAPRFVWRAQFVGRQELFVKAEAATGDDDALLLEAWAMEKAAALGIPVPRVVGLDDRRDGFEGPILVVEPAIGRPLAPSWRTPLPDERSLGDPRLSRAWREAGMYLRILHSVVLDGFGRLDDGLYRQRGEIRGRCETWDQFVLEPARTALADKEFCSSLQGTTAETIEKALQHAEAGLRASQRSVLLHDDLGSKHLFVDEQGRVTSIIDFGDRAAGDPAWDLANVWLWEDDQRFAWALEGYGADDDILERSRVCALADGTRLAQKHFRQGRSEAADAASGRLAVLVDRLGFGT